MPDDKPPSAQAPADNPAVIAHLNMLQGVINRLATQSASCKTWCLSFVSALLALSGATKAHELVPFVLLPVAAFAMIDASYLACERAFRQRWSCTVGKVRDGSYARDGAFEMGAQVGAGDWLRAFFSISVFAFYVVVTLACGLVRLAMPF